MGRVLSYPKFQAFNDNGDPLSGGKVFTYNSGTTIKLVTYSDANLTVENQNPVILDTRGEAWIFPSTTGIYTIEVFDANDVLQWSKDGIGADASAAPVNVLRLDLADSTNVANGDAMIAFKQPFTGAQPSTVHQKLSSIICAFDFMTPAEIADVQAGTALVDVTAAVQNALNAAKLVRFPAGTYKITASLLLNDGQKIMGEGRAMVIFKAALGAAIFKKAASPATLTDVTIEGITVDNTNSATAGGIGIDFSSVQFSDTVDVGFSNVNVGAKDGAGTTHYRPFFNACVTCITASGSTVINANATSVTNFIGIGAVDQVRVIGGTIQGTNGVVMTGSTYNLIHVEGVFFNVTTPLTPAGTGFIGWINNYSLNFPNFGTLTYKLGTFDYGGAGAPALAAPVGSTYRRTDGGAGTSFYVKESGGTGSTGWVGK